MIYLDNSATTKVLDEAIAVANDFHKNNYFNASAVYAGAIDVHKQLENARQIIASSLACLSSEVFFTSGGTESNNTSIFGSIKNKKGRIITSLGEHLSVYKCFNEMASRGYDVVYIPLKNDGTCDLDFLKKSMTPDTQLVSIIHVSNETGAINDIKTISSMVKSINPSCIMHSDGVQAYLKTETNMLNLGVDLYSISAHKVNAPKGVGAIYKKNSIKLKPFLLGGGQEYGLRSSTENIPGIVAFATSVNILKNNINFNIEKYKKIKSIFVECVKEQIKDITINSPENGCYNIISIGIKGIKSEVLVQLLSEKQIYVGSGSACSSSQKNTRVLKAMNAKFLDGSIRISLGIFNTEEEIKLCCNVLIECVKKLRGY